MKKIVTLAFSMMVSGSLLADSCKNYFIYNLAPNSVCTTRSNKTLFKEKDSITIMNYDDTGTKWHAPTQNNAFTLDQAREYCKSKNLRLPDVTELEKFVNEVYSNRAGVTSCYNVNRSFFSANKTSDEGSENVIPVEGRLDFPQRSFEISAFNLAGNNFVTRYDKQKFNVMCVEDVTKSPNFEEVTQHSCSEIWFPSAEVGTKCTLNDGTLINKVDNGYEIGGDIFINSPNRRIDVRTWEKAKEVCENDSMELLNYSTLDHLLRNVTSTETGRKPQLFCVDEFAGSESAFAQLNSGKIYSWSFRNNEIIKSSKFFIDYRVICENKIN